MWIYTYSGLASRCNTLAQAYYFSKKNQNELVVVWPLEDACGIHFREVFADDMFADIKFRVIEIMEKKYFDGTCEGIYSSIKKGNWGNAIRAAILHCMDYIMIYIVKRIRPKLPVLLFRENYFDFTPPEDVGWGGQRFVKYTSDLSEKVIEVLSREKKVYIKAYNGICYGMAKDRFDYSAIKFREEYWKIVKEIIGTGEGYVGIHIRRTDHHIAIKESSTDAFIHKINEILTKCPDIKFFLATDDKNEERELQKLYGDKMIVQPNKEWGRSRSNEMRSGIIDCLCLSQCEYIIGSCGSAYSRFAARYGAKELVICRGFEVNGNG